MASTIIIIVSLLFSYISHYFTLTAVCAPPVHRERHILLIMFCFLYCDHHIISFTGRYLDNNVLFTLPSHILCGLLLLAVDILLLFLCLVYIPHPYWYIPGTYIYQPAQYSSNTHHSSSQLLAAIIVGWREK